MIEIRICFATCAKMPQLQADDRPVVDALERRGALVTAAPWNGPLAPFETADLVVVRSTWDYWDDPAEFGLWLERLAKLARVANAPRLMRWNLDKRYLLDLARRGAPLPPTALAEATSSSIFDKMDELGLDEAVVKPVVSAGAFGLSRIRRDNPESVARAAAALGGAGLVQPLIQEIATAGETSLVYFEGAFSHAVVKHPKAGDIRIQESHGGVTRPTTAPEWAIEAGRRILALLPEPATYARVDVVLRGPDLDPPLWLMEVEVLEPSLYFLHAPAEAAEGFADALIRMME